MNNILEDASICKQILEFKPNGAFSPTTTEWLAFFVVFCIISAIQFKVYSKRTKKS